MRASRKILVFACLAFALSCLFAAPVRNESPLRAIVVAWDGTVPATVSDLLRRGQLPNLAKLIAGGAYADNVVPVFPSKTAPGFASLWTGAPPAITGISGNRVPRTPRDQATILESSDGFSNNALRAEPIWATAQRAGLEVLTIHAPQGGSRSGQGIHIQGYQGIAGRDGILNASASKPKPAQGWEHVPKSKVPPLEISFVVGGTSLFGLFFDDPADPQQGYNTLLITASRNGRDIKTKLKPGLAKSPAESLWSGPITLSEPESGAYLRLFDLKPDASDYLLYFTRPTRAVVSPPAISELMRGLGVFVGNGANYLYRAGAFGRTIPNGGDGIAEARYMDTVAHAQRQIIETNRWALSHLPWRLLVAYSPFPDEAEHAWRGYLDPSLSGYRKEVADRLRPFLEDLYRLSDEFLGAFSAERPANTIVALVSDHGMEGVNKFVAVNRILKERGLLILDDQGRIDLTRTKAAYPSINNGYILINSTDRLQGIVSPAQRPEVVQQIRTALLNLKDAKRAVITEVIDAKTAPERFGIGGDSGGDIYIDLAPGYDFDAGTGPGNFILLQEPMGDHGFQPSRASMHTIMVLNGPGVCAGCRMHSVRLIDFAPTIAKLLHIPPPQNTTGRVLDQAFAERLH
ncbi:MAG TPA: alkaline phosphatase family protein [Candidatus Binatia bacterium]